MTELTAIGENPQARLHCLPSPLQSWIFRRFVSDTGMLYFVPLPRRAARRTRCTASARRCAPGVRRPAGDLVPRLGLGAAAAAALAGHADGATSAATDGATVSAAAPPTVRDAADRLCKLYRRLYLVCIHLLDVEDRRGFSIFHIVEDVSAIRWKVAGLKDTLVS